MKVLMISQTADGAGIAHRLVLEGHSVRLYIKDPIFKQCLVGIVERVDSFRPHITWADLIIGDMVGMAHLANLFSRYGKPHVGFSEWADKHELDRRAGMELLESCDIRVPKWHYLATPLAIPTIADMPEKCAVKPSGNMDPGLTYLCESPELLAWALSQLPIDQELIIQELIPHEGAVEVSTEGWFNGRNWVLPFNHTFEEKRLSVGGVGKHTGSMGSVVLAVADPDRLITEVLLPLEPALKAAGYRGPIDVNCLVSGDNVWALELTPRFGYDAIEALMEGLRDPIGDVLFQLAMGSLEMMDVTQDFMVAVRVTHHPYPEHGGLNMKYQGLPILGINEDNERHIFLSDVYLHDDMLCFAASDGLVLKATARGRSLDEAISRVYRTINNVHSMDLQYRTDIGARVHRDMELLRSWGWIN